MRFVYPGAVYHVMARGDGGKAIFSEKEDHLLLLQGLSRVCGSHGWRVHAWVLIGNHYHLFIETPELNLVAGMMTTGQPSNQIFYSSDFNRQSCYQPPVERKQK